MSLIEKIYIWSKDQATKDILQTYKEQSYAIINFLYFGNAMHQRVFEKNQTKKQQQYTESLQASDYLFADGIALQVFVQWITKVWPENLNGTDFIPYFIQAVLNKEKHVHIALRSVYDKKIKKGEERLDKACQQFHDKFWQEIDYSWQCKYQQRNEWRNKQGHEASIKEKKNSIHILINCSGSPFQENRANNNKEWVKKNKIIVINAWWFVDFLSGFEQRAPKRVRRIRVGETFWRIACNPRKNFKKMWWMFGIMRLPFTYKK